MILDERVEFANDTTLPTATGTNNIGDVVDLSAGVPVQTATRIGADASKQIFVHFTVKTAVTSGGAATVAFQVVTADDAALTTNVVIHNQTDAIPVASLVAGYREIVALPQKVGGRYLGIRENVATAALTAGAIDSGIMYDETGTYAYPDAQN